MARADLFPLPRVEAFEGVIQCKRSRRSTRTSRCQSEAEICNEAVSALNWCSGAAAAEGCSTSTVQEETHQIIVDSLRCIGADSEGLSARDAASSLLKGRLDYSSDKSGTTNMASYGRGELSLPDHTDGSPDVRDVVSSKARVFLQDIRQRMLRDDKSLAEVRSGKPETKPYMDRVLASSQRRYVQFVKLLHSRGLVRFLPYRHEEVAMFFVRKKDNRLRVIVDARRVNECFWCLPPST